MPTDTPPDAPASNPVETLKALYEEKTRLFESMRELDSRIHAARSAIAMPETIVVAGLTCTLRDAGTAHAAYRSPGWLISVSAYEPRVGLGGVDCTVVEEDRECSLRDLVRVEGAQMLKTSQDFFEIEQNRLAEIRYLIDWAAKDG